MYLLWLGKSKATAFGADHATLADFAGQMDAIERSFPPAARGGGPLHRFFIASNDVEAKAVLQGYDT